MDLKDITLARAIVSALEYKGEADEATRLSPDRAAVLTGYVRHIEGRVYRECQRANRAERLTQGAPTHRHRERGTEYRELVRGTLQAAEPIHEGAELVTYIDREGVAWHRPVAEFDDGRFGSLPAGLYVDPRDVRISSLEAMLRRVHRATEAAAADIRAEGREPDPATIKMGETIDALLADARDPWSRSDLFWDGDDPERSCDSAEEIVQEHGHEVIVEIWGAARTGTRWGFSLPGLPGPDEDEERYWFFETPEEARAALPRLARELQDALDCVCDHDGPERSRRPNRDCPVHGRDPDDDRDRRRDDEMARKGDL